jgi:hypothetical protein
MSNPRAGRLLEDMVCCAGTPVADCGLCGRVHYAGGVNACYDLGELENLDEKAAKDPEKYCRHDIDDSISIGELGGMTIVWGCPCNRIEKYERFMWENRVLILEYIKAKATALQAEANKSLEMIQEISPHRTENRSRGS